MEFNWKILSYGKFNQEGRKREGKRSGREGRKNLAKKFLEILSLDSLRINFNGLKRNDFYTNRFVKTGQSASIDSNQVSPQDGVQLGSRKISLSLSAESIKQFLTPVSFQLTRLEMITSSLTRLDGNFIPVARTWWQLKSLSPTVLKTRFSCTLSPLPLFLLQRRFATTLTI